jgi:hypothetical protein
MKKYYDTFTEEYTYHPNPFAPPERYIECEEDNVQNRVIYAVLETHDAGWEGEQKRIKELNMKIGDKFTVNNIAIGSWNTDVYLDEFPDDYFNSVFFNFVDENGSEVDIFKCKEFY